MDPKDRSFGTRLRIRSRRDFAAIHAARVRSESGPLLVYGLPNDLGHLRIGISSPSEQVSKDVTQHPLLVIMVVRVTAVRSFALNAQPAHLLWHVTWVVPR